MLYPWKAWRWPLASGASIFVANGIWHAAICLKTQSYIPGVWTGLLLYIPLGCIVMFRRWKLVSPRSFVIAVVIGMVIHGVTIGLVLRMPGFNMGWLFLRWDRRAMLLVRPVSGPHL